MNATEYLARIGALPDHLEPNDEVLRFLQRRHLTAVPFENLDIHMNVPIVLDVERFYEKIVLNRRGGFCYELNGLFNELLVSLGFHTRLISARVFTGTAYCEEYDHAAIIVSIGDDEYLADVGFGDFSTEPLRFSLGAEQHDPAGVFVIRRFDNEYFEVAKREGEGWKSEYVFTDIARALFEFSEMCEFHQHSPHSHFRKGKICSILTENGRKTLTDTKYIITSDGGKAEMSVASGREFDEILRKEFNISTGVAN